MWMFVFVHVCMAQVCRYLKGIKEGTGYPAPKLELQTVASYLTWVPEPELGSPGRSTSTLNC